MCALQSSLTNIEAKQGACPCGSGAEYEDCCQPYHLHQAWPETAEKLMRSRYCAYVYHLEEYLLETWAEETRPQTIEFEVGMRWQSLEILSKRQGRKKERKGWVKFAACYQLESQPQGLFKVVETSRFRKDAKGHWVYIDGVFD